MGPLIRNISDTALWTAVYRARESERPDALFRDPFARRLAGERGERIAQRMAEAIDTSWAFVTRTCIVDRIVQERLDAGTDLVLNLAAGLDTRPYRMDLPVSLRWVEVDLPEILEYKSDILTGAYPKCSLDRLGIDLANRDARRALFDRLGKGLVISEGLLVYLTEEAVADLARDLARSEFDYWAFDLASPALLKMMQATSGQHTAAAGAPLQFAPAAGIEFFRPLGWVPVEVHPVFETAYALNRLPEQFRSAPPPPPGPDGPIWSGVCLMQRT
jgi:methyltransferase (TIGR00027 family)